MTLIAVDLSHVKTITSWDALCGFADIVVLKATEGSPDGTKFLDPLFGSRLAELRRRGKLIGVYHYVGSSAAKRVYSSISEADWFAANYGWRPGEVPIADYEPANPPADPDAWLAAFHQRLMAKGWPVPLSYMNDSAARSSAWARTRGLGAGLWVARYFANTGRVPASQPSVGSWGGWAMWQYTSNGAVPGVSGPTDVSLFFGTPDQWRAYGAPVPGPVPAPAPPPLEDDMAYIIRAAGRPDGLLAEGVFLPLVAGTDETKNWTAAGAKEVWVMPATWDSYSKLAGTAVQATVDTAAMAKAVAEQLPDTLAQQTASHVVSGLDGARITTTPAAG